MLNLTFDIRQCQLETHFIFLFAEELAETKSGFSTKAAVAIQPGKVDRSPTGTALSARMAILHVQSKMKLGDNHVAASIIGSTFNGLVASTAQEGGVAAIIPEISDWG